jgi:hypothetical protein
VNASVAAEDLAGLAPTSECRLALEGWPERIPVALRDGGIPEVATAHDAGLMVLTGRLSWGPGGLQIEDGYFDQRPAPTPTDGTTCSDAVAPDTGLTPPLAEHTPASAPDNAAAPVAASPPTTSSSPVGPQALVVRGLEIAVPLDAKEIPPESVYGTDQVNWYVDLEGMRFGIPAFLNGRSSRRALARVGRRTSSELTLRGALRCSPGHKFFEIDDARLSCSDPSSLVHLGERPKARLVSAAGASAKQQRWSTHVHVDWLAVSAPLAASALLNFEDSPTKLYIRRWQGDVDVQFRGGEVRRALATLATKPDAAFTLRGKLLAERATGAFTLITATLSLREPRRATPAAEKAPPRKGRYMGRGADTAANALTKAPASPTPSPGLPVAGSPTAATEHREDLRLPSEVARRLVENADVHGEAAIRAVEVVASALRASVRWSRSSSAAERLVRELLLLSWRSHSSKRRPKPFLAKFAQIGPKISVAHQHVSVLVRRWLREGLLVSAGRWGSVNKLKIPDIEALRRVAAQTGRSHPGAPRPPRVDALRTELVRCGVAADGVRELTQAVLDEMDLCSLAALDRDVAQHLAAALLDMTGDKSGEFTVPYKRIALDIGASKTCVYEHLAEWASAGLIRRTGPRTRVVDRAALVEIAHGRSVHLTKCEPGARQGSSPAEVGVVPAIPRVAEEPEQPMPEAEPIEVALRPLIEEFTQKLVAAVTQNLRERVGAEVQAVVERALGGAAAPVSAPAKHSPAPAASAPAVAVAARPDRKARTKITKLKKRTPKEVAKDDTKLLELVKATPGMRSLDIQGRIEMPPQDIASGLRRLRAAGKIVMKGVKSSATYTAAA